MTYELGTEEYRRRYYQDNKEKILARSRARYAAKREEIRKQAKERYASEDSYPLVMLDRARQRARRKGIPFSITVEDIVIPDVCPVLGIPLVRNLGGKMAAPNSPSIDRIDPEMGYVPGNIQVISFRANHIKTSASWDELVKVARWVLETDATRQ